MAFFIRFIAFWPVMANAINAVPITQYIRAFFAVPILSGAPCAVRYKIPAIIQPITTMVVPTAFAVVSILVNTASGAVPVDCPKATTGKANMATNKIKKNVVLFTYKVNRLISKNFELCLLLMKTKG